MGRLFACYEQAKFKQSLKETQRKRNRFLEFKIALKFVKSVAIKNGRWMAKLCKK
jgi:hypothetical protein